MFCHGRNHSIKFLDDYSSMILEAKKRANEKEGLKILTSKQMIQRLPIALAQGKAGYIPENLENQIRQIICSSYQAKEIN